MKYLFLIFILTGCTEVTKPNPRERIINYKCNNEQITNVEKIYKVCNDSGYLSTACYIHALNSFCTYSEVGK